jgi:hypothetical protein
MTKTAVDWLIEQISCDHGFGPRLASFVETTDLIEYFAQAKEMERDQIIEAHDAAYIAMNLAFRGFDRSVEYYEKTYGA